MLKRFPRKYKCMCVQYVCPTGFGDDYSYSIDNILKYRKILAIDNNIESI